MQRLELPADQLVLLHEDIVIALEQLDHLVFLDVFNSLLIGRHDATPVNSGRRSIWRELGTQHVDLLAQIGVLLDYTLLLSLHLRNLLAFLLQFHFILAHYLLVALNERGTRQKTSHLILLGGLRTLWLRGIGQAIWFLVEGIAELRVHRRDSVQLLFEVVYVVLEVAYLLVLFHQFLVGLPVPSVAQFPSVIVKVCSGQRDVV